jgi:serine/threonine protein kinase
MLTGRKPFAGASAIEVLQQHVNAPLPKLPERYAHHQPLLDRLLAKSRDQRYSSAEEVIEAFAAAREARRLETTAA